MNVDFSSLQQILVNWPTTPVPRGSRGKGVFGRIFQILDQSQQSGRLLCKADLQSLIRHALCRQSAVDGESVSLRLPAGENWPSESEWERFGVRVATRIGDEFILEPTPWRPGWIEAGKYSVFEDVFAEKSCHQANSCPIDPCIEAVTGFTSYTSSGQRDAIRSVFFSEPGSTLIITLPTGSGKSLVGQIPALLGGSEGNLIIVVVPTVALALDQERQMRELFKRARSDQYDIPLAWHADLSANERLLVKQNLRNGRQRILFTSPEAICGTLRFALYDAAERGFLKYFVVDEAHLLAQWGDGFRPDFQALSGIRRGLLRQCGLHPFKTVLMTATLTEETLQTLEILFGPPDKVQLVSAVHLRPEPRYWIYKATGWEDKKNKVLETIRHGPRPFVLYVTKRTDARAWFELLKREGFLRIGCFHGETNPGDRRDLIEKWAANELDAMVATSAFGVGISKGDVRMIIHTCVPETLDRFYQEVGRGGRDGRASASVLIYTDDDIKVARGIGSPTLNSKENGQMRWRAMHATRQPVRDAPQLIRVDIGLVPPQLRQQTDYNVAWNLRTLLLLARARVVALDSEPPQRPAPLPGEAEESYDARLEQLAKDYFNHVVLRIVNPRHLDDAVWDSQIADARNVSTDAIERNFELMRAVIEGRREISEALVDLYQINRPGLFAPVSPACGGCPVCRQHKYRLDFYGPAKAIPIMRTQPVDTSKWDRQIPWLTEFPVVVTFDVDDEYAFRREVIELLEILVGEYGVREISVKPEAGWERDPDFKGLYRQTPGSFLVHREIEEDRFGDDYIPLAKVSILYPWDEEPIPDFIRHSMRPFHLILASINVRDSVNRTRRYCDTATNCIALADLMGKLHQ